MTDQDESMRADRRGFVRGIGAVVGAIAAGSTLAAQNNPTTPSPANDINILNYTLTLELLEATFYTQGLTQLSSADFSRSSFYAALVEASQIGQDRPPSGAIGGGLAQDIYAYLTLIRNHEQAHVRTLMETIRSLGGTPVSAPRFQFPYNSADEFIALAATLENTGVAAYNGVIDMISSPALVTASATIATVEGRHAAYLNRLRGMNPFPDAFDQGKAMAEIMEAIRPYIVQ